MNARLGKKLVLEVNHRFMGIAFLAVAVSTIVPRPTWAADRPDRCGPKFIYVEPESGKLLLVCEKSGSIVRMDPATGEIEGEAAVGEAPFALCAHPDGHRFYVSCRRGQEVVELDRDSLSPIRRFPLPGDPTGVAVSADGLRLFVGVHSMDQIVVWDLVTGKEVSRLAAGNGPEMLRLEPEHGYVYVTNLLSNPVPPDQPCRNEITVVDGASARVIDRIILENANVGRWIAFNGDGSMAVAAISRPKNLIPMVQVARGWVVTNGFAVLFPGGDKSPVQLLLDLPNQAFADIYGVAFTPDDRKLYFTSAGMDTVIAVDVSAMRQVANEVLDGSIPRAADHLGLARRYVTARILVGANPEALAISSDGRWLYVCNRLDDSVSVIDTTIDEVVRTIVIGNPPPVDRFLRGERLFHSAARTFQGQFACAGCHPDRGFDGLQYDLEPDGLGMNILDNRNLRGVAGTAPFKWIGSNPDITTQCGTRTAKWIVRTGWLNAVQVVNLASYIRSIRPVVNPYRQADGTLTAAQGRGRILFERDADNSGNPIPERDRCNFCHTRPTFTDGRRFDVGTKAPNDAKARFDTAHLANIFESAPYLHDGRAATLEEIWTKYNPDDRHGLSSDWTKQQLNDLVEYLKSL